MAIEIVDFPIKSSDFPVRYVSHYQRIFFPNKTRLLPGVGDPDCLFSLMLWHEEELGTSEVVAVAQSFRLGNQNHL